MNVILQIITAIAKAFFGAVWERRDEDNEAIEIDSGDDTLDDCERL